MIIPLSPKIELSGRTRSGPLQEGNKSVYPWRKSNASRKERGQGMVEFALVIPILLVLMVGIFEFGYFFFVYSSVNTAAREAVRYGSGTGTSPSGDPYYMDCDGIRQRARDVGRYANIQDDDITISYDNGPGTFLGNCGGVIEPKLGERIVVKVVDVPYNPIILDWFLPGMMQNISFHAESARTIIKRMQVGG